jgi:hypothetical protein
MTSSTVTTGATTFDESRPGTPAGDDHRARRRSWLLLVGLALVLALPLMVALGVLHSPRWYPLLDLAQTELRVRDVGFSHPPLLGLPGRIGQFPEQGSHPGPLSFYGLAPFYRLYGSSAFALQAATATLHTIAIAVALWIARRRGGAPMMLAVGAAAALLFASYGAEILTEGWNPYLPVSWWFVFLLAAWSVGCGDFKMLPVAVFAGSFCMQTHLPYLGLVGAVLGAVVLLVLGFTYFSRHERERVRELWFWIAIAAVVGVVLWLPPLIEQFTGSGKGNLQVIFDDLRDPKDAIAGPRRGLSLLFLHLNPWRLFTTRGDPPDVRGVNGAIVPGIVYFVAWLASAVVAVRTRLRSLVALQVVIGVGLLFAATSMVRIAGTTWFYLVLWSWGLNVLMAFAMIATACAVIGRRLDPPARARAMRSGLAACTAVIVLSTVFFVIDASDTQVPNPPVTNSVGRVARPTIAALASGKVPGGGRDGRYLVTTDDLMTLGGRAYSLRLELEREGFHVGGPAIDKVGITAHRVMKPEDATARVHLVSGVSMDAWAKHPGVVRVAYYDPRSPAEKAEFDRLKPKVIADLRRAGQESFARGIELDNLAIAFDKRIPRAIRPEVGRLLQLGLPVAVFVGPPEP